MIDSVLIVVMGALAVAVALRGYSNAWGRELPWRLRRAELAYAERVFAGGEGVRFSARVDRAYRLADGGIVLVEFKTRREPVVCASDVIEISVQRAALAATTGERVHDHAYLLLQSSETSWRRAVRIRLLSQDDIMRLVQRRQALLAASRVPAPPASQRLCVRCPHRGGCDVSGSTHLISVPRSLH